MLSWLLASPTVLRLVILAVLLLHHFSVSWCTVTSCLLFSALRVVAHEVVGKGLVRVVTLVPLIRWMAFITCVKGRATVRVLLHLRAAVE